MSGVEFAFNPSKTSEVGLIEKPWLKPNNETGANIDIALVRFYKFTSTIFFFVRVSHIAQASLKLTM